MKTYTPKAHEVTRSWHIIDASGQVLGRVATQAAVWLMGKHKPGFVDFMDTGDHVVIVNAEKVQTTGNKELQKTYTRHSGYPGGLRKTNLAKLRAEKPEQILMHAVAGMLPKNKLHDPRLKKLHIVIGSQHPYGQHLT